MSAVAVAVIVLHHDDSNGVNGAPICRSPRHLADGALEQLGLVVRGHHDGRANRRRARGGEGTG